MKKWMAALIVLLFYGLLTLLWQMIASYTGHWAFLFPPPQQLWTSFMQHLALLFSASLETFLDALVGLSLGALLAILLSLILQQFRWIKKLLYPLLYAWQAAPVLVTTTLILLWMGFGWHSRITLIILASFFPIYVAFSSALATADDKLIRLLASYGANGWQIFRRVRWPLALVGFFSGLRLSSTYVVSIVMMAQWLGGQAGLGHLLLRSRRGYDYALMMNVVILSITLSLLFIGTTIVLERLVLAHYRLNKGGRDAS